MSDILPNTPFHTPLDTYQISSHDPPSPELCSPHEPVRAAGSLGLGPTELAVDIETGTNWQMPDMVSNMGDRGYAAPLDYHNASALPNYSNFYPKPLHHSSSNTSLNSTASDYSGLHGSCPPSSVSDANRSRHSSISSIAGLDRISPRIDEAWNGFANSAKPPDLQIHAQSRMGRMRSASRVGPYDRRERSESLLSDGSELGDGLASLVNSTSSVNGYQTPLTSIGQPLSTPKMTLHHRRSSSNFAFSPVRSSPNPMLSRKHRSSSILGHAQRLSIDHVRLLGSAADREESVRLMLHTAAEEMRSLPSASQQDKAKSAWVKKWLQLSYTVSPGHTVPRQGLYASYAASTEEYGVRAINSASFGKAVRNAFQGIKTRRLGVRGNSKYHYIALRPAISIEAERLNRFGDSSGQWHVAASDGTMTFQADFAEDDAEMEELEDSEEEDGDEHVFAFDRKPSTRPGYGRRHTTTDVSSAFSSAPMMPTPVYDLPGFPVLGTNFDLGPSVRVEAVYEFWNAFCRHQELLVSSVRNQHFDRFDTNLHDFWGLLTPAWMQVCHHPAISQMISDGMASTYNYIVVVLTSGLQRPLSSAAQQTLRELAARLENCVETCLAVYSREFAETKTELAVRAAHLLHRCVDIHQLSSALLPIISSHQQVSEMIGAWDRLDTKSIADQCALSCGCEQAMIERVLQGFRIWLGASSGIRALEKLGQWVDMIVDEVQRGRNDENASRTLVTRAGFLTSQIMRDFTLKSASSFGLFQLIKTWIDDWIAISLLRPCVLTTASASPVGGMSVSIPRQNPLLISEEDLPTAVPPPFRETPQLGHRQTASTSSIQFNADGHASFVSRPHYFMPDLASLANLSVSGSAPIGFGNT